MKIKKVLGLLTVMVVAFAFALPAAAYDEVCVDCKCPMPQTVPCPEEVLQEDCWIHPFDFEIGNNYCKGSWSPPTVCRACLDICECDDPLAFGSGDLIGIRMTILVNDGEGDHGAYWAEPFWDSKSNLDLFKSHKSQCVGTAVQTRNFGNVTFYLADYTTTGIPNNTTACTVDDDEKVVRMLSNTGSGYTVTSADILNNLSHWWIDIPKIRLTTDIAKCDKVSVKIELLSKRVGGICAECEAVCECIIDVALACCDCGVVPEGCIYFPYVITGSSPWVTGLVVTNLSSSVAIAEMEATFTLTDDNGDVFCYTKTDFDTKVWAFNLDGVLADWGWAPLPGAAWLKVETNFLVDGYQFLCDGVFGAGTLPRNCYRGWWRHIE